MSAKEGLGRQRTRPLMAGAPMLFTMTMNSSTANMTRRSNGDIIFGVQGSRARGSLSLNEEWEEARGSMMSSVWWLLSCVAPEGHVFRSSAPDGFNQHFRTVASQQTSSDAADTLRKPNKTSYAYFRGRLYLLISRLLEYNQRLCARPGEQRWLRVDPVL